MAQDPEMIRALARRIAGDLRATGMPDVQIHANAFASLNGRAAQRLIDPDVDLAGPLPSRWISPLERDPDLPLTAAVDRR